METLTVYSSSGEFEANLETGEVIENCIEGSYDILKVDIDEWEKYWKRKMSNDVDILDIGMWYIDPKTGELKYSPAEEDWRQEIKKCLELTK